MTRFIGCIAFVLLTLSCTATPKQVATGVLDVSDAVCTELATQPEPEWVTFTCAMVDIATGVATTFKAKVKREDANQFAMRHCAVGTVAP